MYTSPSLFGARRSNASMTYQAVHIESQLGPDATPHRLVSMLFDGLMEALAQGKGAIVAQDLDRKIKSLTKAANIVEEGLRGNLDLKGGGQLAADLNDLYAYVVRRVTHANIHNDVAALDECVRLITPIKDAWNQIGPGSDMNS